MSEYENLRRLAEKHLEAASKAGRLRGQNGPCPCSECVCARALLAEQDRSAAQDAIIKYQAGTYSAAWWFEHGEEVQQQLAGAEDRLAALDREAGE